MTHHGDGIIHMDRDEAFMARAIQLALENVRSGRGGPFGAVVVKDGKVVAEAANQVTATNDPTAHAEVLAIRQACQKLGLFELKGCALYTSCEPCPMCLGAIYWARIDKVYFGTRLSDTSKIGFDDEFRYIDFRLPWEERKAIKCYPDFEREDALKACEAWQNKKDRHPY